MEWAKWDNYSHEHNSTAMAKYQAQPSPSSQLSTIHKPAFIDKTTMTNHCSSLHGLKRPYHRTPPPP